MFDRNPDITSPTTLKVKQAFALSRCVVLCLLFLMGAASGVVAQSPGQSTRDEVNLDVVSDNRLRADTSKFPFSAIVKLRVTFPDSTTGWGTGALIGPDKIITAEHVVFSLWYGGHAAVEVLPGYSNGWTVCAKTKVIAIKHGAHQGCHSGAKCDVAILTTERKVGCNTGWFGFKEYGGADVEDVYVAGYPSDLDEGERLYFVRTDARRSADTRHNILEYTEWTAQGMSGGPIFTSDFFIVGIHTNGGTSANYGVGLCTQLVESIREWKAQ